MADERTLSGVWKPDSATVTCGSCDVAFTLFRRRHHCRSCGGVFCTSCSNTYVRIPLLHDTELQRVCRECNISLSSAAAVTANASNPEQSVDMPSGRADTLSSIVATALSEAGTVDTDTSMIEEQIAGDVSSACIESDEYDDSGEYSSSSFDSGDVSAAVAAVYSSVEEGPRTSSMTFIAALQDNLKHSDDPSIVKILMYASPARHQLILVTVNDGETMSMLAERLADSYLRLESGPFRSVDDAERKDTLSKLRFSTSVDVIGGCASAVDVAMKYRQLVLSAYPLTELHCQSPENPVSSFFGGNYSAVDGG
uniref:Putative zinc finger protein n=1 Tax=Trypanosoma congolense (strain IL3000) TaxID=1068625 RepID=G0UPL5_TRYCI|nr:putative zinc finger protein [Trypanosoma congolense IL3000]